MESALPSLVQVECPYKRVIFFTVLLLREELRVTFNYHTIFCKLRVLSCIPSIGVAYYITKTFPLITLPANPPPT